MRETHRKLETDPMFALEHRTDDVQKKSDAVPTMEKLEERQGRWKDDYLLNKAARNKVQQALPNLAKLKAYCRQLGLTVVFCKPDQLQSIFSICMPELCVH